MGKHIYYTNMAFNKQRKHIKITESETVYLLDKWMVTCQSREQKPYHIKLNDCHSHYTAKQCPVY